MTATCDTCRYLVGWSCQHPTSVIRGCIVARPESGHPLFGCNLHEPRPVADPDYLMHIPMTAEELDWVTHAAKLRGLSTVEYVRRAINLSLRKEGVDAVLLRESDDPD